MSVRCFEDIVAWQKAQEIAVETYSLMKNVRDFAFKDQLQRAAVSISNNIAEGFERKTNKEFIHFLYISKGSVGEVRSMLSLAPKIGVLNPDQAQELQNRCVETSRIISGLIKSLK